jgi:hypothetical protein
VEVPALDRHPARSAAHRDWQDPALQAAGLIALVPAIAAARATKVCTGPEPT